MFDLSQLIAGLIDFPALFVQQVILRVELVLVGLEFKISALQCGYTTVRVVSDVLQLRLKRLNLDLASVQLVLRLFQTVE